MNDVRDFMITQPPLCTPLTSIEFIQKLMDDSNSEEIMVVDTLLEKHLVGTIDVATINAKATEQSVAPESLNAEQCMKPITVTVRETASLEECARILNEHHLNHLAIVDEYGHLCGIYDPSKSALVLSESVKKENTEIRQ